MSKIGDSPCKGCGQRYVGCHGHCEQYKGYNIRQEARRAEHLREASVESGLISDVLRHTKRHSNKWGGKG